MRVRKIYCIKARLKRGVFKSRQKDVDCVCSCLHNYVHVHELSTLITAKQVRRRTQLLQLKIQQRLFLTQLKFIGAVDGWL